MPPECEECDVQREELVEQSVQRRLVIHPADRNALAIWGMRDRQVAEPVGQLVVQVALDTNLIGQGMFHRASAAPNVISVKHSKPQRLVHALLKRGLHSAATGHGEGLQ